MKSSKITESKCWNCEHRFNGASDMMGSRVPSPGSASICIECAAPGIFQEDLTIREPTKKEMEEIVNSPEYIRHMVAIHMAQSERFK